MSVFCVVCAVDIFGRLSCKLCQDKRQAGKRFVPCGITCHNKCPVFPLNCLCQYRWAGLAMTVQWSANAVAPMSRLLRPRLLPSAHYPVSQLLQQWPYQRLLQLPLGLIWSLPHILSVSTAPTANLEYFTFLSLSLLNVTLIYLAEMDSLDIYIVKFPNLVFWCPYERSYHTF